MTFEEWWAIAWPHVEGLPDVPADAQKFMEEFAKGYAKKAWEFGRVELLEEWSKSMRAIEKVRRENAEKSS